MNKIKVKLRKSNKKDKKFMVTIDNKNIHFGSSGMSDYRLHKNDDRRQRYIKRHRKRENWTKSGIKTAGFWSRWLLWEKKSTPKAKKNIENKFNVKFI